MNNLLNNWLEKANFILENLHFVRADWFYAFIPLVLFLLFSYSKSSSNKNWHQVIDKQLQPFVLTDSSNKKRRYPLLLTFIACSLCITALAGPVYEKLQQPVYREQSSLIILLDLSQSMNAEDVKPSRLARAKLELLDILKTRKTGQTAFIVYAADAFTVTPLTDDNATIANLIPSLETSMMPAQGSNLSKALAKAYSLFTQSGIIKGNILLITDSINKRDESAIEKIASQGHRLSIFGIGTRQGSPIPLDGGFLQDQKGAIVIPKLEPETLQRYALQGGGLYTSLQADDSDVNKLTRLFTSSEVEQKADNQDLNADVWQEEGFWLLLPLLFFASLWARKGWLAIFLIFILPMPQPAYAETSVLDIKNLWSSPDQRAMKAFNAGDNATAAENFTQAEWKASSHYRNGDYENTVKALEQTSTSDGHYNKGNALAQLGKYEEAITAFDKAIELDDNNEDAKYNREQVSKALEKQKSDNQQSDDQSSEDEDSEQQDSDQQNSEKQDSEKQDSDNKDSDEQQSQQQDAENTDENSEQQKDSEVEEQNKQDEVNETEKQQPSEQSKAEEEKQLKQRDPEKEKQQQQAEQEQYEQDQKDSQNEEKENESIENKDGEEKPKEIEINPVEASITEQEKATEQWLKRIPDDPGGLLKRKFLYQYNQIPNQQDDTEPW